LRADSARREFLFGKLLPCKDGFPGKNAICEPEKIATASDAVGLAIRLDSTLLGKTARILLASAPLVNELSISVNDITFKPSPGNLFALAPVIY
jgi:hypothetical protein